MREESDMIMSVISAVESTAKMGQELFQKDEKNKWVLIGTVVILLMYFMVVLTKNCCVFFFKLIRKLPWNHGTDLRAADL